MVNKSKTFITTAVIILTLTGCGNDVTNPDTILGKDCPDFTASIDDVRSRATESRWEPDDEIGISGAGRTNVCYSSPVGDGIFTVKSSGNQIYFQGDDEETFTAYYPWNDLSAGTTSIKADIRNQSDKKSFDFLWASSTGKKAQPSVNFNFAHSMCKVVFTVQPGNGMSFEEVKSALLSIGGFCYAGSFNVVDGIATADSGTATEKWVFTDNEKSVPYITDNDNMLTCSLIFFPQVLEAPLTFMADFPAHSLAAKIDFTSANREKDGADAKNEWVAGRQYNLSLTLHKTELTLEGCAINPWNDVKGDEIEVD